MDGQGSLETVLRRDRWIALAALSLVTVLAWVWLAGMALSMSSDMPGMTAKTPGHWSAGYAAMMFVMWAVMMVGMMLPSAAPMILLHARVVRRKGQRAAHRLSAGALAPAATPAVPGGLFLSGYVAVWTGFSLAATGLQWWLESVGLVSVMMAGTSSAISGMVLIAAGVWQLTPWKEACLANCRGPAEFLAAHWRDGPAGAVRMGLAHGLYCLGCCWVLMLLLFVGGVMNLACIAALTAWVLAEKLAPPNRVTPWATALVLCAAGATVIATGWTA